MDWKPGSTLLELKIAAIRDALARNHGNRTHAARELGISVRTLRSYIATYPQIDRAQTSDATRRLNGEP